MEMTARKYRQEKTKERKDILDFSFIPHLFSCRTFQESTDRL